MRHKCLMGKSKSHQELICFFRVTPKELALLNPNMPKYSSLKKGG